MRKYDMINAYASYTAREIVQSEDNWRKYLTTASRLYKYPFQEQLLIYAQRSDATACASMNTWNNKMFCWVNKGAKGIALLDEHNYSKLRYVFDVSDVHKSGSAGRLPHIWEMNEEHTQSVMERLDMIYGGREKKTNFFEQIKELAERVVGEIYQTITVDMETLKNGSALETVDKSDIAERLRQTLSDSIAYGVLKRCGASESVLKEMFTFPYIQDFNTLQTLSQLGANVSNLTKPILVEIGKTVMAYDKAQSKENKERGSKDGSKIRTDGGLPDSNAEGGGSTREGAGKIWIAPPGISEEKQERHLHGTSTDRKAEGTPIVASGASGEQRGGTDCTDEGQRKSHETVADSKSSTLAGEDGGHHSKGRGNRKEGENIQVNQREQVTDSETLSIFSQNQNMETSEKLPEMMLTARLCQELGRNAVVDWNEDTQSIIIKDGEGTLEGKAAYDVLFSEAADYIKEQTYNGNSNKGLEMADMINQARKYASRYNQQQDNLLLDKSSKEKTKAEKVSVKEKLTEKKVETKKRSKTVAVKNSRKKNIRDNIAIK